jgi:hypothetical protein
MKQNRSRWKTVAAITLIAVTVVVALRTTVIHPPDGGDPLEEQLRSDLRSVRLALQLYTLDYGEARVPSTRAEWTAFAEHFDGGLRGGLRSLESRPWSLRGTVPMVTADQLEVNHNYVVEEDNDLLIEVLGTSRYHPPIRGITFAGRTRPR